jgi:hypothetical protein
MSLLGLLIPSTQRWWKIVWTILARQGSWNDLLEPINCFLSPVSVLYSPLKYLLFLFSSAFSFVKLLGSFISIDLVGLSSAELASSAKAWWSYHSDCMVLPWAFSNRLQHTSLVIFILSCFAYPALLKFFCISDLILFYFIFILTLSSMCGDRKCTWEESKSWNVS